MKKRLIIAIAPTVILAVAWQNLLNLLVWALPKIQEIRNPVPPNKPITWQAGPDVAVISPDDS